MLDRDSELPEVSRYLSVPMGRTVVEEEGEQEEGEEKGDRKRDRSRRGIKIRDEEVEG